MANPFSAAVEGVKSFLGIGAAGAAVAEAPAVPEETLNDAQLRKAKRILEKADKQSKSDKTKYDRFVKQYRDGILQTDTGTPADWVKANQVFPYVNVLLSLLYHQNPQIAVMPRLEAGASEEAARLLTERGVVQSPDEARKVFAETLQTLLTYSSEEGHSQIQNNACLFECLTRGLGWTKSVFDPIRGIDKTEAFRRDEIFIDPHARQDPSEAEYIVQICVKSLEEAKSMFQEIGYAQFDTIEANWKLVDDSGITGEKARENDPAEQKDCFRYYEKWCKEGAGRYVDYFHGVTKAHMKRTPWPFVLDYEEFPFEEVAFNKQYTQVADAFPDLQVVESLWRLYEYLIEYFHRHVKRSIAKKFVYDRTVFTEEDIEQLKNAVDLQFVGAQKVENRPIADLLQVVDFNSGTDTAATLAQSVKQIAEQILGLDEIQKGGVQAQKEITATHAEILDEYGRLRLGRRQKLVDEWLTRQVRHRAQIARQLVTADKVRMIAGEQAAQVWEVMSYSPEDLVGEYTIEIIAGTSGERAKRAKVAMMNGILNRMIDVNKLEGFKAFDILAYTKDIMSAEGEKKPQRYELPPPEQQPTATEDKFDINGAAVDGLFKLVYPLAGQKPLASWNEARILAAEAIGVPPEQFTEQMAAELIPQKNPFEEASVNVNVNKELPPNAPAQGM